MIEALPWPWPKDYAAPQAVKVVYCHADGRVGQCVETRPEKVAAHAQAAAEDGCTIVVLPSSAQVSGRTHRVENGAIVTLAEPVVSDVERMAKARLAATGTQSEIAALLVWVAALERAVAKLDHPEADEVRRIREALDEVEPTTPDSQERKKR